MKQLELNQIKEVYDLLEDNVSKCIFENRLMYSLTEDVQYIRKVACTIDKVNEVYHFLKENEQKKIIFGAGSVGKRLVKIYDDIEFECFVDNNCMEKVCEGLPVLKIDELKRKYSDALIIISTKEFHNEILHQLLTEGFKEDNIVNIGKEYERLNHLQYFDLPQLRDKILKKEVFVDGGCYDGISSINFVKWCFDGREAEVFAWEPDPDNQRKCRELFKKSEIKYELIPKGLWSELKQLKFKMGKTSSEISEDGDITIEVDSIDRHIKSVVTFIKMDIEGSEYQALLGAKNMISEYKPKLAICVYHKPEDIWELPNLIHRINPEYRFYLRHYSFADVETVLYAL